MLDFAKLARRTSAEREANVKGTKLFEILCAIYRHWGPTAHPLIPLAPGACPGVDIPFRCSMKSAPQKADAGLPCPRSIATSFPHERKSAC